MDDFNNKPENNIPNNDNQQDNQQNGNVNGEYHFVPPKNQYQYYNPNQNQQYQQPQGNYSNNYYAPPQPPVDNNGKEPKKVKVKNPSKPKNKTVLTIVIVLIICVVLAIVGVVATAVSKNGDSSSSSSSSSSQSADNGSGSAKVEDSNGAAKKDSNGNLTTAGVVSKVQDSCVGITVYTQQSAYSYFNNYGNNSSDGSGQTASGTGSGVIMSEANGKTYIMTAAHVISDGSSFKVKLNNGDEYDATMVGYDSQTDIGVLSIKKTGLTIASFGNSDKIDVGEDCIAIGCPGGLEFMNSVTKGIVSALDRPVKSSIGYNNKCIQVDAAINPGNSGGALFNMQGQVIGINSSKIASTDYEGMGFAVPSNTAVDTANSLIKNGYVAGRAKLGIQYNTLSNYNNANSILSALEQKGFKDAEGTMVIQEISDDSDLKNSKVQQYDMIVAVNGKTMTSTDILTSVLSESSPGDSITLTIARIDGNSIKTFDVKCKLIESKN